MAAGAERFRGPTNIPTERRPLFPTSSTVHIVRRLRLTAYAVLLARRPLLVDPAKLRIAGIVVARRLAAALPTVADVTDRTLLLHERLVGRLGMGHGTSSKTLAPHAPTR